MSPSMHSLRATHFAELGAGFGSADCLAVLRAGQASRRRLLLRAVAEVAPATKPALELLSEVAAAAPGVADAALCHPLAGVWMSRWLRRKPDDAPYLAGLIAAASVQAGIPFSLDILTSDGSILLPGLGNANGLGRGRATVRSAGDGLVIAGPGTVIEVPAPYRDVPPGWRAVRRLSIWEGRLTVEDVDPHRDCFGWPAEPQMPAGKAEEFEQHLVAALHLVEAHHPSHAEAMRTALRMVVPLAIPADGNGVSAASRLAFGAVGVGVCTEPEALAELLIHEFQHMKLGGLLDMVDLHTHRGSAIHCAPWRADPRPIEALLQGTYAHLAVADYWRMRQRRVGGQTRQPQVEFSYWLAQIGRATATLGASGELTVAGERFIGHMRETIAQWACEFEPSDIEAGVEDLADSSAIVWRLRNWQPAPVEPRRLAELYRAGAACPTLEAPSFSTGTQSGPAKPAALARMLRDHLCEPSLPLQGSQSDAAFVRGDHRDAISAYRDHLATDSANDDAWAGMALALRRDGERDAASALLARPDLVRAVFREAGGDPVAIAAWLSPKATVDRYRN